MMTFQPEFEYEINECKKFLEEFCSEFEFKKPIRVRNKFKREYKDIIVHYATDGIIELVNGKSLKINNYSFKHYNDYNKDKVFKEEIEKLKLIKIYENNKKEFKNFIKTLPAEKRKVNMPKLEDLNFNFLKFLELD